MERRLGRRVWRRGFSAQWGESEMEEIKEFREVSFEWRTCHRLMKDQMVREETRRCEKLSFMRLRRI